MVLHCLKQHSCWWVPTAAAFSLFLVFALFCFTLRMGVAWDGLELSVFLPRHPEFWDHWACGIVFSRILLFGFPQSNLTPTPVHSAQIRYHTNANPRRGGSFENKSFDILLLTDDHIQEVNPQEFQTTSLRVRVSFPQSTTVWESLFQGYTAANPWISQNSS